MDKIVEIANFYQADEAEMFASLLRAEGIACYVRNGYSNRILQGYVDIGARVEVLDRDVPRALKIMEDGGFMHPEEEDDKPTALSRFIPFLRNISFGQQIALFILLIAFILALLIYINSYLTA
ncbi:MAG: DUF2007 domain-containing protein [Tannerella sp.]|jgi:hypothetical protein|nr:DUF2007 domain-containing protein [Tannerella sp.]